MNKRKILESAQKHLQRGALDKALEDYQTLLKADPKDSNIRLKVGDLHLKLGRSQDAIDAYLRVAQQFANDGFDAKAVALYKQITKLDDKRFEVHTQLGELYQRMGLASEAMKALQVAADGAHRAGDKGQALTLLRRMAALDPTNTASRLKVADLLWASGQPEDALSEYDEVVKELARQNNGEEQLKVLERALEIDPNRAATLRAITRVATELGNGEKSERAARTLLAAQPDDPESLELAGNAFEAAGLSEDAAGVFRSLAEKYRARGDEDRARALTQRYGIGEEFGASGSDSAELDGDPSDLEIDPELDASLGLVDVAEPDEADDSAGVGEVDVSAESSNQAVTQATLDETVEDLSDVSEPSDTSGEVDPTADFDQLLAEASVFARYGKQERAVETLRAALRVRPGDAVALEKLGEALAKVGNRAHAASALTRAGAAHADAGDAAGVERVRALLAPLDAKAAAALAPPARAATKEDDLSELDVDIDSDLDMAEPEPSAQAPAPAESDDFSGIEIDVSSDFADAPAEEPSQARNPATLDDEAEFTFDTNEASGPAATGSEASDAVAGAEPDVDAAAESGDAFEVDVDVDGASEVDSAEESESAGEGEGATSRVEADFEEAEFYREQGMKDEARGLYERVLAAAPDHADARRRLEELSTPPSDAARKRVAAPAPEPRRPAAPAAAAPEVAGKAAPVAPPAAAVIALPPPPATPADEPMQAAQVVAAPVPTAPVASVAPSLKPAAPAPAAVAAALEAAAESADAPSRDEPAALELGASDFDLAAELSGSFDGGSAAARAGAGDGEGFAEVFAAFKEGVKREVGDGDHEAHYDLGIAYKEMGLFDDAIGEFRIAMGDAQRRIACLHMMGACALELGRGPDAAANLSEALASGALPADQEASLRLDLGRAYAASGDRVRARSEYDAVNALAPGFGDVDRLIEALATLTTDEPSAPTAEVFESFDDLVASETEPPSAPAQYESFDELVGEHDDALPAATDAPVESEAEIALVEEAEPAPEPTPPPPAPARAPAAAPPREPAGEAGNKSAPAAAAKRKKKISFV